MSKRGTAASLTVRGVSKRFGVFSALSDISLDIAGGEFLTLLGPSGSGKTTLLLILAGFEAPSEGRLLSDGKDITEVPAETRSYGMVFQGYALFPHMSVEANIAFPLQVRRTEPAEIKRRVGEMIERVGLRGHEKKLPAKLSGGQQQRVALARALVFEPGVLLLDEPFSALDKNLREQMQAEVKRLHEETGTTFVFVTHDQSEALALSTRVAIFDHGRLQQIGRPDEVYEQPANRFVAEFLGEINLLPLKDLKVESGIASGQFEDRRLTVQAHGANGAESILAIRPEHLSITPAADVPRSGNAIRAALDDVVYQGGITRLKLKTPGGVPITLSLTSQQAAPLLGAGGPFWINWPSDQGRLLPS
jgi:putative spermidine/putrescine transport system ATP-binding protein